MLKLTDGLYKWSHIPCRNTLGPLRVKSSPPAIKAQIIWMRFSVHYIIIHRLPTKYLSHLSCVSINRREQTDLLSMDALKFCNERYLVCGSDSPGGKPAIVQIWDIDALANVTTFPAHDTVCNMLASKVIQVYVCELVFDIFDNYQWYLNYGSSDYLFIA